MTVSNPSYAVHIYCNKYVNMIIFNMAFSLLYTVKDSDFGIDLQFLYNRNE